MIFGIIKVVNYILIACIVIQWVQEVPRWLALRRGYGAIPWSLVSHMIAYTRMTAALRPPTTFAFVAFCLACGASMTELSTGRPLFDDGSHSVLLLLLLLFVWTMGTVSRLLMPPTAMLLGTSSELNLDLLQYLNSFLRRYRVVGLLHDTHFFAQNLEKVEKVTFNNLRTEGDHQWKTVVHHFVDVIPVIIVNSTTASKYLEMEIERIKERNAQHRTIFVTAADLKTGSSYAENSDLSRKIAPLAGQLAGLVMTRIWVILDVVKDSLQRRRTQEHYAAMLCAVPLAFRYSSSMNGLLSKAGAIQGWCYENYLREFKGISSGDIGERLVEEIPSKVSIADEQHYLRKSIGFEQCEDIFSTAWELAEKTPGPQQKFNVANANVKLGKLAWIRQDYGTATRHLNDAISQLEEIITDDRSKYLSAATTELEDAHYFFWRMYLARYHHTNDEADRIAAEQHYRLSVRAD